MHRDQLEATVQLFDAYYPDPTPELRSSCNLQDRALDWLYRIRDRRPRRALPKRNHPEVRRLAAEREVRGFLRY
ncbi:MAG: hypothetical protein ACE5MM_03670 [Nitrospiraceae bacterium]